MKLPVSAQPYLGPAFRRAVPLKYAYLAQPFDRLLGPLPEGVEKIPSMMSPAERRFLFNAAKDHYTGAGVIVDAGIFMGASTVCLGSGLKQNPNLPEILNRWKKPIISLELGITNQQMLNSFKAAGVGKDLDVGDSFRPVVERFIAPVADIVDLRFGDIRKLGAIEDAGKDRTPVEICFLDVLKSPEISEYCIREYFPRLIPHRSLLIQQDYLSGELPFIHCHQEMFASRFSYVGELSSMAVFCPIRKITRKDVAEILGREIDGETKIALISQAIQRSFDPYRRVIMSIAKLKTILSVRGHDAARQYLEFIEGEYGTQISHEQYRRVQNVMRAARYLVQAEVSKKSLREALMISTGHRGIDHRNPGGSRPVNAAGE